MHEVDWDSLYASPADRERDAVLGFIWKEAEALREENPVGAFALIQLAHSIEKGKHLGT